MNNLSSKKDAMNKRLLALLSLIVIASLALAACGGGQPQPTDEAATEAADTEAIAAEEANQESEAKAEDSAEDTHDSDVEILYTGEKGESKIWICTKYPGLEPVEFVRPVGTEVAEQRCEALANEAATTTSSDGGNGNEGDTMTQTVIVEASAGSNAQSTSGGENSSSSASSVTMTTDCVSAFTALGATSQAAADICSDTGTGKAWQMTAGEKCSEWGTVTFDAEDTVWILKDFTMSGTKAFYAYCYPRASDILNAPFLTGAELSPFGQPFLVSFTPDW